MSQDRCGKVYIPVRLFLVPLERERERVNRPSLKSQRTAINARSRYNYDPRLQIFLGGSDR